MATEAKSIVEAERQRLIEQRRKLIEEEIQPFSPEHLKLQKVDLLIQEMNDALTDLSEMEINIISFFISFHREICPIPAVIIYLHKLMSLRRSRGRMGRQEYVEVLKKRPTYMPMPYYPELDDSDGSMPVKERFGWIKNIFMRGMRR